jgi:hypothetical protein
MKTALYCLTLLTVLLLGFPSKAEAYLDPSTGSMVLQVVAGGFIAGLAAMKLYWSRIRAVLKRDRKG